MKKYQWYVVVVLFILVALSTYRFAFDYRWHPVTVIPTNMSSGTPTMTPLRTVEVLVDGDLDTGLIFEGIKAAPTFRSTLKWFTGTWVGQVPFYRPLTSLGFWTEYHLFGPKAFASWQWVTFFSHLLVVALAFLFFWRFSGDFWLAALVVIFYSVMRPPLEKLIGQAPALEYMTYPTLFHWKNQPDLWATASILGCLLNVLKKRWWLALVLATVAVGFKEIGWIAFPMALTTALFSGIKVPRWVWITAPMIVSSMLAIRFSTIGMGYQMGTNANWWKKAIGYCGGSLAAYPMVGNFHFPILLGTVWGVLFSLKAKRLYLGLVVALFGVLLASITFVLSQGVDWVVGFAMLVVSITSSPVYFLALLIWSVFAYYALRGNRRLLYYGLIWMVLGAIPMMLATQAKPHGFYFAHLGQMTLLASATLAMYTSAKAALRGGSSFITLV